MIPGIMGMMAGMGAGASPPAVFTWSGWTVGLDTSTDLASYSFTITDLPDTADQVIVVVAYGERAFAQSATVNSITADSGAINGTLISTLGLTRNTAAVYYITGVTGTSSVITANFSNVQLECLMAYGVISNTTQTTYHARSGATFTTNSAASITTPSVAIPTDGVGIAVARIGVNNDQTWSQNSGVGTEGYDQTVGTGGIRATAYSTLDDSATTYTVASTATARGICAFSWGP